MSRVKNTKDIAKADQFKRQYKLRMVLGSLRLHAYVIRPEEKAVAAASTLWQNGLKIKVLRELRVYRQCR